mgnify:CR=1 FL=1
MKKKTTTKPKKRNPADLTKRNNDARKKEVIALERRVRRLEDVVGELGQYLFGFIK